MPDEIPAENIIQLGPVKKTSIRPPDPVIPPAPAGAGARPAGPSDNPDDMLAPYPDGVLLRCSPKPEGKNGEYLVHDGAGQIVAGVKNKNIANLFCCAVHLYIRSAESVKNATPGMPPAVAEALAAAAAPEVVK